MNADMALLMNPIGVKNSQIEEKDKKSSDGGLSSVVMVARAFPCPVSVMGHGLHALTVLSLSGIVHHAHISLDILALGSDLSAHIAVVVHHSAHVASSARSGSGHHAVRFGYA